MRKLSTTDKIIQHFDQTLRKLSGRTKKHQDKKANPCDFVKDTVNGISGRS